MEREQLEAGLDDPGDPYGLANTPDFVIDYFAACFEEERFEQCRRIRQKLKNQSPAALNASGSRSRISASVKGSKFRSS